MFDEPCGEGVEAAPARMGKRCVHEYVASDPTGELGSDRRQQRPGSAMADDPKSTVLSFPVHRLHYRRNVCPPYDSRRGARPQRWDDRLDISVPKFIGNYRPAHRSKQRTVNQDDTHHKPSAYEDRPGKASSPGQPTPKNTPSEGSPTRPEFDALLPPEHPQHVIRRLDGLVGVGSQHEFNAGHVDVGVGPDLLVAPPIGTDSPSAV